MSDFMSYNVAQDHYEDLTPEPEFSPDGFTATYYNSGASYNTAENPLPTDNQILNTLKAQTGEAKTIHNATREDLVSIQGLEMTLDQAINLGLVDPLKGDTEFGRELMSRPNILNGLFEGEEHEPQMIDPDNEPLIYEHHEQEFMTDLQSRIPTDAMYYMRKNFAENGQVTDQVVNDVAAYFNGNTNFARNVVYQFQQVQTDAMGDTVSCEGVPDVERFYQVMKNEFPHEFREAMNKAIMSESGSAMTGLARYYVENFPYLDWDTFQQEDFTYEVTDSGECLIWDGEAWVEWTSAVFSGIVGPA